MPSRNYRLSLKRKMYQDLIPLEHIGIIIKEELLEGYEVTAYRVCKDTGIITSRIGN